LPKWLLLKNVNMVMLVNLTPRLPPITETVACAMTGGVMREINETSGQS
jgi:hypothetical protein